MRSRLLALATEESGAIIKSQRGDLDKPQEKGVNAQSRPKHTKASQRRTWKSHVGAGKPILSRKKSQRQSEVAGVRKAQVSESREQRVKVERQAAREGGGGRSGDGGGNSPITPFLSEK